MDSIFEAIYRKDVERAKNGDHSGTGQGLALCKQIADLHEAEIKVQSDRKGTTFTLIFTTLQQFHENLVTA